MGRLIDAEKFKLQVAAMAIKLDLDPKRAAAWIKIIDKQPTAYDVDILKNGFEITRVDGQPIDYEALGKKYGLCYCDMEGFAVTEDGTLILLDECGRCAYTDSREYQITLKGAVKE